MREATSIEDLLRDVEVVPTRAEGARGVMLVFADFDFAAPGECDGDEGDGAVGFGGEV